MPPISLGTSHSKLALETGQAKLWIFLIGVNEYQDLNLPKLSYPAVDCQGLSESLIEATQAFPQKNITIYHDFSEQKPILANVKSSLENIVTSAQTQDTILFYFSGHGLLDTPSQQTVLCLADTQTENLLKTGLVLQTLLTMLSRCLAHCQVIWLDACHCGNMTLRGAKGATQQPLWDDPTTQLLDTLRQRAAKSKGFYALLSCDQGQKSWEFPDLGHGVFSYFLMRGLRGEAADITGVIKADQLYQYVYNQTLNYIDKINQQLRLINQQRRYRGDAQIYSEYSLQTPKRIVEGVGELILGVKSPSASPNYQRYGLIIGGLNENKTIQALEEVLAKEGQFSTTFLSSVGKQELEVREEIQSFLQLSFLSEADRTTLSSSDTLLIYLRGRPQVEATGDSYWVLENGTKLSRSWLRQELRRSHVAQQIIILDGQGTGLLEEWIEELQLGLDHGQCLLGALNPNEEPNLFAELLLDSLVVANPQTGLSGAQWLSLLQQNCDQLYLPFSAWLSGIQGVIDILPGKNHEDLASKPKIEQNTVTFSPYPPSNPVSEVAQEEVAITPTVPIDHIVKPTEKPLIKSDPDPISSEEYATVSAFLTELVGPIALPLLQSALEETNNRKELLETLAQYLSSAQKIQFDQWAIAMFQDNNKIDSPPLSVSVEQPKEPSPQTKEAITPLISPEQYSQLESILKAIIGPIAPTLLAQTAPQVQQFDELIASLKDYLNPIEQTEFEQQLVLVFGKMEPLKTPVISEELPLLKPTYQNLDETLISDCEKALTEIIGPVAHFIIQTTLEDCPEMSRTEFIEVIAANISDPQKSVKFRQQWIT
ncbi:caspase family protein [Crocosphaera chwakensis]|uniref:Peptidase C14, caspase catalytic subunit p20 n=1 Tax=Crocosphaera chwakensis CCY0110 TaxID=391612 RepID=A3IP98_9CHRO|nr:caspase family protein [Crocosphaera chwakensis]EAZ91663.1 Peptidase C14, caspase catalytic subunit p20 [Crocosphaera chwakensis CCY0110]